MILQTSALVVKLPLHSSLILLKMMEHIPEDKFIVALDLTDNTFQAKSMAEKIKKIIRKGHHCSFPYSRHGFQ